MDQHHIRQINALAELERYGIIYEVASPTEVKCKCPFHDDHSPSCFVNIEKRVFKCQTAGCEKAGDILSLLAAYTKSTRAVIFHELSSRYDFEEAKIVDPNLIEKYHLAIWKSGPFIKELYKRGLSDDIIRKYRLGFNDGRITIPIKNAQGMYVNIRKYLPGAPGKDKMRNLHGRGSTRIYPYEQLRYNTLILCGGEIKALATLQRMNAYEIGAITITAGEGHWDPAFTELIKDKIVYVCMDIDKPGRTAAESICARIKEFVTKVYNLVLPLNPDKYPKGDINDYFGQEHKTPADLLQLMEECKEWESSYADSKMDDVPENVTLIQSTNAVLTGKRIALTATVGALAPSPYVIPKLVRCACTRDQEGCCMCPVYARKTDEAGHVTLLLHPESPAILELVGSHRSHQREALMGGLHIPACKTVDLVPIEYYNVEDVRLRPQLSISNRSVNDIMQPALCVHHGMELNEDYTCVGRMYPHPKTQESVLLISESALAQDALSNYSPTRGQLEALLKFQPKDWTLESLEQKLHDIYNDFAANVTRIYQREELHLAMDLAYHSVLLFNFDGKLTKGWVECLIVGDSSQGKSETMIHLKQHYGLGEKMDCKNATIAGLLGGLQQLSGRWFVTWGIIPTHDKMLVILEELKGASTHLIAALTDMRSSGIAELPKIEKRRTHARTRLIAISNPRSDQPLASYNFGVEVIPELIGSLEDIRRFDFAVLLSQNDIAADRLNELQAFRPRVEHVFDSDACRRCVLWAWTREPEHVVFEDGVERLILKESTRLCALFHESIPLIDKGGMRLKLARLSISLACRTFSTDDDFERVIVRECHVMYIVNYLSRMYSAHTFGYLDYSKAIQATHILLQPDMIKRAILQTPFPSDVAKQLLYTNRIELCDLQDWCGWERAEANQLLSLLVRKHALQRDGRAYRKTPEFIILLKELLASDEMKMLDRPEFIKDEF